MQPSEQAISHSTSQHEQRHTRVGSRAKTDAVLRLLRGEPIETISEELDVSVGRIERWKERFVAVGSAELAKRTDVASKHWAAKHMGSIWQWVWLLVALVAVISILVVFMQRGGQE